MSVTSVNTAAKTLSRAQNASSLANNDELARSLLSLTRDVVRADELAGIARQGAPTAEKQSEIEEFHRVGRVIETLKLRAKLTLNRAG